MFFSAAGRAFHMQSCERGKFKTSRQKQQQRPNHFRSLTQTTRIERASLVSMTDLGDSFVWKESHKGCKDELLTVKLTAECETKENCQPSPDSSNSPQQTAVDQNSASIQVYLGDVKGMFSFSNFRCQPN